MDLVRKATEKGFLSKGKPVRVNEEYYLWMCELKEWLRDNHDIYVDVQTETTSNEILGFVFSLKSWRFPPITVGDFLSYELGLEEALQTALKQIQ